MRGYYPRFDPNGYESAKWEGRTVAFNGSERTATVLRAYWQGPGKAVQLYVSENGSEPFLTDSEHVTIVKEG